MRQWEPILLIIIKNLKMTYKSEKLIITRDGLSKEEEIEVFLNDESEIYFGTKDQNDGFYFILNGQDWEDLKEFIENQINKL